MFGSMTMFLKHYHSKLRVCLACFFGRGLFILQCCSKEIFRKPTNEYRAITPYVTFHTGGPRPPRISKSRASPRGLRGDTSKLVSVHIRVFRTRCLSVKKTKPFPSPPQKPASRDARRSVHVRSPRLTAVRRVCLFSVLTRPVSKCSPYEYLRFLPLFDTFLDRTFSSRVNGTLPRLRF